MDTLFAVIYHKSLGSILSLIFFLLSAYAAGDLGIEGRTLEGGVTVLDRLRGERGTVLIVREAGCPIAEKLGPRIKAIESQYTSKGINFIYLYAGQIDVAASAAADRAKNEFGGYYIVDADLKIARRLGLQTTTESVVFDGSGKEVYRGAVDDQHTLTASKLSAANRFLIAALEDVLSGRKIVNARREAPGCQINFPDEKRKASELTFNADVYPVLERKCIQCHRAGLDLIDLSSYAAVRGRARTIRYVVDSRLMPPWPVKHSRTEWINDLSLTAMERSVLNEWLGSEMKEGETPLEKRTVWSGDWRFGKPDAVIRIPRAVQIPPDGQLPNQHFVIDNPFNEDRWVKSFEIRPKAAVVHHVVVHVLKEGADEHPDRLPHGFITRFGWALGNPPGIFPAGVGAWIPAKSKIAITVHYQPIGVAVEDRETEIGFQFHAQKPEKRREEWMLLEPALAIPPGAKDFQVTKSRKITETAYLMSLNVHMHMRGKKASIALIDAKGRRENLLTIDPYNFKHQFVFDLKTPRKLAPGSTLECKTHFENESKEWLRWGDDSSDEMSICSIYVYR